MRKLNKISILIIVFVFSLPLSFANTLSYSVVIEYNEGAFSLKDILLVKAAPMPVAKSGDYTARVISFRGDILFETAFNMNLEPFYSIPLSKETAKPSKKLTKTNFDLLLPYYANAKSLQILKGKEILFKTDLSKFSTCNENKICDGSESLEACPSDCTCGNNVCDTNENYMMCSSDCHSGQKDNACDKITDGICDPDCDNKEDYDCKKMSSNLFVYILIVALLIIGFFVIKKLKASNKTLR